MGHVITLVNTKHKTHTNLAYISSCEQIISFQLLKIFKYYFIQYKSNKVNAKICTHH